MKNYQGQGRDNFKGSSGFRNPKKVAPINSTAGTSARSGVSNPMNNFGNGTQVGQYTNAQTQKQLGEAQKLPTEKDHNKEQEEVNNTNQIIIHVCDENRKLNKDFKCNKEILLSQMKYFEKFRQNGTSATSSLEDLDISVHCDLQIFEWLMKYLLNPQIQARTLETGTVISILISAEYLQMPRLVQECVNFMKNHLQDVLRLPIDLNCITSSILKDLASVTQIEDLDELKDRKDKLISKLYMKKLEIMLGDENNALFRCVYCNKLFTRAQKTWMICSKAKIFIDFHGTVIAEHVADRSWDANKFIYFLRQQGGLSWREIHWKIWGHLVTLHCGVCDRNFVGAEIGHCRFHSQKAKFGGGSKSGIYPCCNAPAIRFDTALKNYGCCAQNHQLSPAWVTPENELILSTITARYHIIAEGFISDHNYVEECKALEAQMSKSGRLSDPNSKSATDSIPLSKVRDSPSLQILLNKYVATVGESCCSMSEDEEDEEEFKLAKFEERKGQQTILKSPINQLITPVEQV